jgi:hypothetical protein
VSAVTWPYRFVSLSQIGHLAQHGEAQPDLAHETRASDPKRQQGREPGPRSSKPRATWRREQGQQQRQPDEGRAELGEQSRAEGRAEHEPPARPLLAAEADQRVERHGPGELVEDDGLEQVGGAEEQRARQNAERGERLGPPPAAELPGHQGREDEQRRPGERRHEADGEERITEHGADRLRDQRDGRREVHPPEPEVPPHRQVEQLVPVKAVRRRGVDGQVQGQLGGGEPGDDGPRRRVSPGGVLRCGAQSSRIRSFRTHTLVAKNSRIMAA